MTRQDFEHIAEVIRETPLKIVDREKVASKFATLLAKKNPRFNKEIFLKACGVST